MGWFNNSECILEILLKMLVSLVKIIQLKSWSSFLCLTADQILCRQKKVSFEEKYIMSWQVYCVAFYLQIGNFANPKKKRDFFVVYQTILEKFLFLIFPIWLCKIRYFLHFPDIFTCCCWNTNHENINYKHIKIGSNADGNKRWKKINVTSI